MKYYFKYYFFFILFASASMTAVLSTVIVPFRCMYFLFYLGFLSRTFTNHRAEGEDERPFFNSSLSLPRASQTLRQ